MAVEEPGAREASIADIREPGGLMTIAYLNGLSWPNTGTLVSLRCLFCRERLCKHLCR